MLYTTLKKIHALQPPKPEWDHLLKSLKKAEPDDESISLEYILTTTNLPFTLFCCQSLPVFDKQWRLFAIWCARQVQSINQYKLGLLAIDQAERFANGEITLSEFERVQTDMAADLALEDGTSGKTAAATTYKIASIAAQLTAASAARAIANYAGRRARSAVRPSRDEMEYYANASHAYDSARLSAWSGAHNAQFAKFKQLLSTINADPESHRIS